jgi:prophage regulatory protein
VEVGLQNPFTNAKPNVVYDLYYAGQSRLKIRRLTKDGAMIDSAEAQKAGQNVGLLSRADLHALRIRASNPTLLIWESKGRFPKRLTLTPAKVAWLRLEVIAWIEAKAAARA